MITKKTKPKLKKTNPRIGTAKKMVKQERKPLIRAQFAQCFWVHDGPVLADLSELKTFLGKITAKQWAHHVTKEKNDFANWVKAVLFDDACAKGLSKSKTPAAALKVVEKALK
ncbi:hypothetical protein L0Y69_00350 [bacterium]|nr:hypothetical protein [bacterium]